MKVSPLAIAVSLLFATAAAAAGWAWLAMDAGRGLELRRPFPADAIERFTAALPGQLETFSGQPAEGLAGSWPRFRGPAGDGINRERVPLAETWPPEGPPRRWSIELGEGYAGAAVHRGRVYVLDYDEGRRDGGVDEERRGDALRCFSLADGKEIWRRWYHLPVRRYHGISRTVPAVSNRHVVSLGPMGHVLCCDAESGAARWSLDLVERFGAQIPEWYAGQCPLIDEIDGKEAAILAPGGDRGVLMIAIECASGETLWTTPNPDELQMTHSSITRVEIQGEVSYVYCTSAGVVGINAADGKLLWRYPSWQISPAIVPTPVRVGERRLFLSGGYKAGSVMLRIGEDAEYRPVVEELFRLDCRTFGAEQQSPICYQDCIYGVLTKNAGPNKEQLTCLSTEGATLWASGPQNRFELGPFAIADGKLFVMNDTGVLTMIRPSASGYAQLARAKVLEGRESWGPMAIAGGLLLVRDLKRMVCLDLRAEGGR